MSKLIPKNKPISSATAENYAGLLADIKQRIRTAQVRTAMAGNASMLMLYWEIGGVLAERQKKEGWGAAVLPRLATDLHNDLPEMKGFSARNLRLMIQFFSEYPAFGPICQRSVAKLPNDSTGGKKGQPSVTQLPAESADAQIWQRAVAQLTWAHNATRLARHEATLLARGLAPDEAFRETSRET
jgi:hypothetical protein